MVILEEKLKNEKAMTKGYKTLIKKLKEYLIVVGVNSGSKHPVKKLLEDKDKTIQSLKKKLKIPTIDHTQTEELLTLQREKHYFQQEVLNLKEKILQIENEGNNYKRKRII